jgi:hypothetical protein
MTHAERKWLRCAKRPPEPWDAFFTDLDSALNAPARLDCIGGFVVTQLYGLNRPTANVDFIELVPRDAADERDIQRNRVIMAIGIFGL